MGDLSDYNDVDSHPQGYQHSPQYGQPEQSMGGGRNCDQDTSYYGGPASQRGHDNQYDDIQPETRPSYGRHASHGVYENPYGDLQPRTRGLNNPSFAAHQHHYPYPYPYPCGPQYESHYMAPTSHQNPGLGWNTTSFGPTCQPGPAFAVVNPLQIALAASSSRPTSSYKLNSPDITGHPFSSYSNRLVTGPTSSHQLDVLTIFDPRASSPSNHPAADSSNDPPAGAEQYPQRIHGRIYIDGGASVLVEECPCCKRGFE
jgi:hypothetical protein